MFEGFLIVLGISYAAGANVTGVFLLFAKGPKLSRWFFRNRPEKVGDWLSLPFLVAFSLFYGLLTLMACSILWPVTVVGLFRDLGRARKELLDEQAAEFECLLKEVREAGKGVSVSLTSDHSGP